MPYNLTNRKAGGKVIIDGKIWKLKRWFGTRWLLSSGNNRKSLYIADIHTGSVIWDKQVLEYALNRRLYKMTGKYNTTIKIIRIATAKDLARCIRALSRNIEKL